MITILIVVAVVVVIGACVRPALRLLDWLIDHGDPFAEGLTVNAAADPGIDMTMPPEIAHEAPTRGAAQGRAVRVRANDSRPAARADLTGSLTPRPLEEDPGALARGAPGFLTAPLPQSSPALPCPATPPRRAQGPGTAAAAGFLPAPAPPPPLPRLLPPAAAAIHALRVLTAPHRAAQARAWHAEVLSVFPPDRPWPGDDTLTRMTAIKGDL